jgi:hypothetical protein
MARHRDKCALNIFDHLRFIHVYISKVLLSAWMRTAQLTAILLTVIYGIAWGQTIYTWTGAASGNWTASANWSPERLTSSAEDFLVFDTSAVVDLDFDSSQTIAGLCVANNSYVVFTGSSAHTININGGASVDFQIEPESTLVDSADFATAISLAAGATGNVSGTFIAKGASAATAHRLITTDANSLIFQSGSLCKADTLFSGNLFGATAFNSVTFADGSVYAQKSGSNPFGATQPNSVVVFQTGSLFRLEGNSSLSFSGRSYADFECSVSGITSVSGGSAVTIDNFTITSGTLNFNMTGTGTMVRGNILVAGGATLNFNPASPGTINLNGLHEQTIGGNGTINANANSTIVISNASGVKLQRDISTSGAVIVNSGGILRCGANVVSGSGSFSLASGATLGIGSPEGITGSGYAGNIQVTGARSFDSGAKYVFNASCAQHTGSGMPAVIDKLAIENSAGVILDASTTIIDSIILGDGNLSTGAGALTLGVGAVIEESGGAVIGNLMTTRNLSANNTDYTFGGMGLEIKTQATGSVPDSTQVKRVTGIALSSGKSSGIRRHFEINPALNSGLNADLVFHFRDAELNGQNELTLQLFQAATTAGPWQSRGGAVDVDANTISVAGINSFSVWTAADENNDLSASSSSSSLELFIVSDPAAADSAHAILFPCVGMSCSTVYGEDDWSYDSPVLTFYVTPIGSQSICATEFEINWDASKATLNAVKGNMFDFFAVQEISAGRRKVNTGASSSLNESPSPGKYLAKLQFTIVQPGFSEITIAGTDFRCFDGEAQQGVPVTAHPGMIKFYLGDFASSSNVATHGDGKINFEDLVQFALSYFGESDGEPSGYKAKFDVGPTNSLRSYFAMPDPDGRIQFEDLAIFSIAYGKTATLQLPKKRALPILIHVRQPSIDGEGIVAVPLAISGAVKDLRAVSVALTYPSSSLKYLRCEKSGGMDRDYCFMAAKAESDTVTLDAATIGIEHDGLTEEGTFALVFFKECDRSTRLDIGIQSVKARDSDNQDIPVLTDAAEIFVTDVPTTFALCQNYPNPFNAKAVVGYQIPPVGTRFIVSLKVYDLLGQEVATLFEGMRGPGIYETMFDGRNLASGIYLYRLAAGNFVETKKLVLLK